MNRKSKRFFIHTVTLFIIFTFSCLLFGCNKAEQGQEQEEDGWRPSASTLAIEDDLEAQHQIFLAFAKAYPDKISGVEFINDDWTMLVNGRRFYYAHGRFLPEALRGDWEKHNPYDFYEYPWTGTEVQRQIAFKYPVYSSGSSFLFDTLYESPEEDASWDLQEKYSFLGVKMLVHAHIKPKLDVVQEQIRAAAKTDKTINKWISELHTGAPGYGWNWRVIAGTNRRSNHSYGTAIDLLPVNLNGRLTYWRWNEKEKKEFNIDDYYTPPEKVIKLFEDNGFIWGGYWELIDTMHFEYRPELLLLNGYEIKQ